jgi:hypothetical protein
LRVSKGPLTEARLISKYNVPFNASGVSPKLRTVPFKKIEESISKNVLFKSIPSNVTDKFGAGVILNWKLSVNGLIWKLGIVALFKSVSCQPGNEIEEFIRPNGSDSEIGISNS